MAFQLLKANSNIAAVRCIGRAQAKGATDEDGRSDRKAVQVG
jgi:hypothetical protein